MSDSFATHPTEHTARKEHICDWCGTKIEKGERYAKWCWFENGTAEHSRESRTACSTVAVCETSSRSWTH